MRRVLIAALIAIVSIASPVSHSRAREENASEHASLSDAFFRDFHIPSHAQSQLRMLGYSPNDFSPTINSLIIKAARNFVHDTRRREAFDFLMNNNRSSFERFERFPIYVYADKHNMEVKDVMPIMLTYIMDDEEEEDDDEVEADEGFIPDDSTHLPFESHEQSIAEEMAPEFIEEQLSKKLVDDGAVMQYRNRHNKRYAVFTSESVNENANQKTCVICMEAPDSCNKKRKLACLHDFCTKCLKRWMSQQLSDSRHVSCPLCRTIVAQPVDHLYESNQDAGDDENTIPTE